MRFLTVVGTVLLSILSFTAGQQPVRSSVISESVTSSDSLCASNDASSNLQQDPSLENTYRLIFKAPNTDIVPNFVEAHWTVTPIAPSAESATVSYNVRVAGVGVLSQSPDSTIVQEGVVVPSGHSIQFYHTYAMNDIQCETQKKQYLVQQVQKDL